MKKKRTKEFSTIRKLKKKVNELEKKLYNIEKTIYKDEICHYSGLPSVSSYKRNSTSVRNEGKPYVVKDGDVS